MTINIWTGNKARVDTRKVGKDRFDAVIYPDGNNDPEKAEALVSILRQGGYEVLPGPIPQAPTHTLNVAGFRDASDKARTLAAIRHYVDLLHLKINETESGFQVTGFSHQGQVEEVWRAISGPWYESRKDIKIKHELHENPPVMGVAVHGISDEKTLFSIVEKSGWASGERQDEYHGMSAFSKQWAMMVKNASKYASFMYMLGEGQVLLSIVIDAARQKISPLKHKGIMEPIGYLAGSATMFAGALLREPATVDQVVGRFDKNFQVGGDHDYEGKADGFAPDGKDMGRGAFTIKEAFKHNGTEILMFLNTVAAAGVWNGRYRQIMQVSEPDRDGIRNAELNDDGTSKKTEKLAVKNAISGIMLGFGTLMYALLPKIGRE
ncbi:MAG: hypothetical protein IT567_01075, partial [Alphaproteobacteria bacterium]|nr:hypothetical protein [Alphaproteobacteria bacterium]